MESGEWSGGGLEWNGVVERRFSYLIDCSQESTVRLFLKIRKAEKPENAQDHDFCLGRAAKRRGVPGFELKFGQRRVLGHARVPQGKRENENCLSMSQKIIEKSKHKTENKSCLKNKKRLKRGRQEFLRKD